MGSFRQMLPVLCIGLLGLTAGSGGASELCVMASNGFATAFRPIASEFERATAHEVVVAYGPTSGQGSDALSVRLAHGQSADVFIMAQPELDDLVAAGVIDGATRVDLARSGIGIVVRAGASHPDITTVAGLKAALLAARSVAASDGVTGTYVAGPLLEKLGIAAAVAGKVHRAPGRPVAVAVARGEADIGLGAASEMLATPGVDYLGPLPRDVQQMTVLTAAIGTAPHEAEAARALIDFLTAPPAVPVIMKAGLEPILKRGAMATR